MLSVAIDVPTRLALWVRGRTNLHPPMHPLRAESSDPRDREATPKDPFCGAEKVRRQDGDVLILTLRQDGVGIRNTRWGVLTSFLV